MVFITGIYSTRLLNFCFLFCFENKNLSMLNKFSVYIENKYKKRCNRFVTCHVSPYILILNFKITLTLLFFLPFRSIKMDTIQEKLDMLFFCCFIFFPQIRNMFLHSLYIYIVYFSHLAIFVFWKMYFFVLPSHMLDISFTTCFTVSSSLNPFCWTFLVAF